MKSGVFLAEIHMGYMEIISREIESDSIVLLPQCFNDHLYYLQLSHKQSKEKNYLIITVSKACYVTENKQLSVY